MKLEKPIIYFDIESTGTNTEKDRIIELACVKYNPDGTVEEKYILVSPEMPIPQEASDVHGITDEKVKDKPTFKQYAVGVRAWFQDCDLAGYNSNVFDIPLLSAEFFRAGLEPIDWNPSLFDLILLYRNLFPNTLSDVYKRLTGKDLENAHSASEDIYATKEIADILIPKLQEQSEEKLETIKDIDVYLQGDKKRFDLAGKLYIDAEGVVKYAFGKDINKSVKEHPGFAEWMLKGDFPKETKNKIKELIR